MSLSIVKAVIFEYSLADEVIQINSALLIS